ncbi:hypothetical protein NUM3379_44370 [Kineococcus sp. NUM-3379]
MSTDELSVTARPRRRGRRVRPTGVSAHSRWRESGRAARLGGLAAAVTLVGALLGLLVSALGETRWEVEATLRLVAPAQDPLLFGGGVNASALEREVADSAALAVSEAVLAPAAARLGDADWTTLQDAVEVEPNPGTDILTVLCSADSSDVARERMRAITESFAEVSRQQTVDAASRIASAAAARADNASAGDTQALRDVAARSQVLADTAQPVQVLTTTDPRMEGPSWFRDAATGAVLALILTAAVLAFRTARPASVSSERDASEILGLPAGSVRDGAVLPASRQLIADLRRLSSDSTGRPIVVIPVGVMSRSAADEVAGVLRAHSHDLVQGVPTRTVNGRDVNSHVGDGVLVRVTGDPASTVVAPECRTAGAIVLAVERSTSVRDLRATGRLFPAWDRRPDAVIVVG